MSTNAGLREENYRSGVRSWVEAGVAKRYVVKNRKHEETMCVAPDHGKSFTCLCHLEEYVR